MTEEDSCGKKTCKNTGSCLFGICWDIMVCPFLSVYKCGECMCSKCCCCKKKDYQQPNSK